MLAWPAVSVLGQETLLTLRNKIKVRYGLNHSMSKNKTHLLLNHSFDLTHKGYFSKNQSLDKFVLQIYPGGGKYFKFGCLPPINKGILCQNI